MAPLLPGRTIVPSKVSGKGGDFYAVKLCDIVLKGRQGRLLRLPHSRAELLPRVGGPDLPLGPSHPSLVHVRPLPRDDLVDGDQSKRAAISINFGTRAPSLGDDGFPLLGIPPRRINPAGGRNPVGDPSPWSCLLPRTPLIGRKGWGVRIAESGKRPEVFPDTFKLEAVAAVQGGRPVPQVAAELAYRTVKCGLGYAGLRVTYRRRPAACD